MAEIFLIAPLLYYYGPLLLHVIQALKAVLDVENGGQSAIQDCFMLWPHRRSNRD